MACRCVVSSPTRTVIFDCSAQRIDEFTMAPSCQYPIAASDRVKAIRMTKARIKPATDSKIKNRHGKTPKNKYCK